MTLILTATGFYRRKYSFHFVSSQLGFIMVRPLVCVLGYLGCGGTMGVAFIGCFHMMSPQKGPQSSSFNFCILLQNKPSRKISWLCSVFTHKYGSLNLIHIVAGLGKIIFYFIDENQDQCKANRAQQANPERAFPRSYQGDV